MQPLKILLLAIIAAISYGILHDQITARVCVEYFTIGHPVIVPTTNPTILAFVWGIVATWWVGAILGLFLAIVARLGGAPKRDARSLVRPVLILMGVCASCALAAGICGYLAAQVGWIWLESPLADTIPAKKHAAFLADGAAHLASYASGFIGGVVLIVLVWHSRRARDDFASAQ